MLPPQQKESAATAMLGTLAGTPTIGAGALLGYALGTLRNPNDLYVGILKSRTIADRLIERFNLRELYRSSTMIKARKKLSSATWISTGRDGLRSRWTMRISARQAWRTAMSRLNRLI
jgi:hypothetical protein